MAQAVQRRYPGQRGPGKPIPVRGANAGFETELLGATQHLGNADPGRPAAVTDLPGFRTYAMTA